MLHTFSTNLVKLMTRKPKTTDNLGRREYKVCTIEAYADKAKDIFCSLKN